MSGEMAVAFVKVHTLGHHDARWWVNGGELAALYALIWLFYAFAEAGPVSLDARRRPLRIDERAPSRERDVTVRTGTSSLYR